MKEYKKDPLRSQARRDIIKVLGEKDIVNKSELAELTNLSPLTINAILREFRNYKIITCHIGGLYTLSGEGREFYIQLLSDKRFRKRDYELRIKGKWNQDEPIIKHTIIFDDKLTKEEEEEEKKLS